MIIIKVAAAFIVFAFAYLLAKVADGFMERDERDEKK